MGRIGELEVHNTARFAAAQDNVDYGAQFIVSVLLAGVFDELHTQYVFGSDGRYLLVCHFNAVDTGLYGPTTADAHAVAQIVHLQTGNAEIVQQVVGTERAFQLAFGRQDDLLLHSLNKYGKTYKLNPVCKRISLEDVPTIMSNTPSGITNRPFAVSQ